MTLAPCPNSRDQLHHYTYSVGSGLKSDFEPVQFGQVAADTLYKRVEYSYLACSCGETRKAKVNVEQGND